MNECRKDIKVQLVTKILHRIIYFMIFLYNIIRFKTYRNTAQYLKCGLVCVVVEGGGGLSDMLNLIR